MRPKLAFGIDRIIGRFTFSDIVVIVPLLVLFTITPQLVVLWIVGHVPVVLIDIINTLSVIKLNPMVYFVNVVWVFLVKAFIIIYPVISSIFIMLAPSPLCCTAEFIVT